jgi:hypothetical protein
MIQIDYETARRRAWLSRWHSATVERRVRFYGWATVLAFVVLGAAR